MLFCPFCSSLLLLQNAMKNLQFICQTCEYYHPIHTKYKKSLKFANRIEEDIFGEDKNADKTEANCMKCGHNEAYFIQMQTRSADEPTTIFYRCVNNECQNTWKEN